MKVREWIHLRVLLIIFIEKERGELRGRGDAGSTGHLEVGGPGWGRSGGWMMSLS